MELAAVSGMNLIVTGGNLRILSLALVGPLTKGILEVLFVDKVFIRTMGFTAADGLTTTNILEAIRQQGVEVIIV